MNEWAFLWVLVFFITTVIAVAGWRYEYKQRIAVERLLAGIVAQLQNAEKYVNRKK